jgi:hypothetical protein
MLTGSSLRLRPLKRNDTGAHKPSPSGWRLTLARFAKNAFGWPTLPAILEPLRSPHSAVISSVARDLFFSSLFSNFNF